MSISNRGFGLMSAALALAVLVGCSGESNPYYVYKVNDGDTTNGADRMYALRVVASPANGGYVWLDPDQARYSAGTTVTATVAPTAGYVFTGWSGASTSKDTAVTVTMDGDKALTANFAPLTSN